MRVLFITMPAVPHWFPMVPLAWGFRAAGHEVRVAGSPPILGAIASTGLAAVPLTTGYDSRPRSRQSTGGGAPAADGAAEVSADEKLRRFMTSQPDAMVNKLASQAEAMVTDLLPLIRDWRPDLVLADPIPFAAPLIAEMVGAPFVRMLWGPVMFLENPQTAAVLPPEVVAKLCARYGVTVRDDYAARTIDPCPPRMSTGNVPNRIFMQYVPYNGPGELPPWLVAAGERPRVCLTWGTSTARMLGDETFLLPQIVTGLAGLDVEVVVAANAADRQRLGPVPENVRVMESLPLNLLLPTCAAVVHTGGSGTTLTAAALGVPQVAVVERFGEQRFNAEKMAAAGAGIRVAPEDISATTVTAATSAVLTDTSFRTAAAELSAEIRALPTPAEVVGALVEVATGGSGRAGRNRRVA
ncbi:nucleotide disphospho-sugar-binding domain-containing protein [Micromonospora eburnea]|uniref:UDP:flavonoid glycosyltransferase YjiC, YdhE family n=1 Tax=Micromonospora eburnea TaxID=227316 RepID=A0A1C6V0V0_9ACTN|nr:nucleotide disphospho-sugar-binding domain-containing protein [Micromonospora eburnea]SCL59827.1 UDP:flavonoid glycosyltransferase YjiC, YdhE family [Micromonospora eburnea]